MLESLTEYLHGGRVPRPHPNHLRKTVFMPAFNAVLLVDTAAQNVFLHRF